AAAAPAASAFAGASPLAVPISRRPAARPADLSRAVAAAVAASTQPAAAAAAAPRAAQRAAPQAVDEDDDEPELAAARTAPRIPTTANVARQATFANAINLSRVNLIGIYGTPGNRYAMIRTPQGRFNRITVGDRVDGGTVAAITATEVRYQKGGRMLALQMPRG
ncbi:MAG TPA: translation initiation factor 2, partial [Paracoccaceae bacterium]|nr:translation initiation factor 2 [Paracoccaceae bacterium]